MNARQQKFERGFLLNTNQRVASYLLDFFKRNFRRGGATEGTSFVPWSRRKYTLAKTTLVDTGYLRSQFRKGVVTYQRVQIVNDTPYADFHNDGTSTLPRRPIIYESKRANQYIAKLIGAELKKYFSGS